MDTRPTPRIVALLRGGTLALSLLALLVALLLIGLRVFGYLSIWALLGTILSMALLIMRENGRVSRHIDTPLSIAAVLNTVLLVIEARTGFDSVVEALPYLAGLWVAIIAPVVQIAAALANGAFRQPRPALAWMMLVVVAYILTLEVLFRPTGFLPYPALPLEDDIARLRLYGLMLALALLAMASLAAVSHILVRNGLIRRAA